MSASQDAPRWERHGIRKTLNRSHDVPVYLCHRCEREKGGRLRA